MSSHSSKAPSTPEQKPSKGKKSMRIVLKISPNLLRPFAPPKAASKTARVKSSSSSPVAATTPLALTSSNEAIDIKAVAATKEEDNTPVPSSETPVADPPVKPKRKGGPFGPKPGSKRTAQLNEDGTPKPRGKPGPKKKPRLEDGTIDHSALATTKSMNWTVGSSAAHKLGPKANQGAINAGLRALDRSGKPCRRWEKKAFQVKSFTGVTWALPSWKTPLPSHLNGDVSSNDKTISQQSRSNSKGNNSSAGVESSTADNVDTNMLSDPPASSPIVAQTPLAVQG